MRSLVVGRFQPLHLGHLRMIEHVAEESKHLVIGIGSSNREPSADNPFTAGEREEMFQGSLKSGKKFELVPIPDFGDDEKWIAWIKENIEFDVFWTNSPNERRIFEEAGCKVNHIPFFDRDEYSATEVRRRMMEGGDWERLVPAGTAKVIERLGGGQRLRSLSNGG
ncbi:MAG: nicotinamide-nucleotide adenylyltransferase [Candidatus Altiarchaeota archaeon]